MKKIKFQLWLAIAGACALMVQCSFAQIKKGISADSGRSTVSAGALKIKENALNTVVKTGPDGFRYKLVQIGDLLPKLYVNGRIIPTDQLDDHGSMVDKLNRILWDRQKEAARQNETRNNARQQAIVSDLVKDGLVKNEKDVLSFRLTSNEFTVNERKQSFTVFNRYVKKYIKSADKIYQFNYSR